MKTDTDTLITALSTGLQPVKPPPRLELAALLWLAVSAGFVIAITYGFGPIRPNALAQLLGEPRFLLETLLGVVAIAGMAVTAFRSTVPGASTRISTLLAAGLVLFWLANYVLGLAYPALEPSMLGKRQHCMMETLLFALPPAGLALLLSRRFYSLRPVYSAALFALAASMLPALYMQIACMYEPAHILKMHIAPALLVTATATLGTWVATRLRYRQR